MIDEKRLSENFIELINFMIETKSKQDLGDLKSIAVRHQKYELAASIRGIERELFPDEVYETKSIDFYELHNPESTLVIHDMYIKVMHKLFMTKEDIDNLPFWKFQHLYNSLK